METASIVIPCRSQSEASPARASTKWTEDLHRFAGGSGTDDACVNPVGFPGGRSCRPPSAPDRRIRRASSVGSPTLLIGGEQACSALMTIRRHNPYRAALAFLAAIWLVTSSACAGITAHENYLENLYGMVGRDIRNLVAFDRMGRRTLANGNAEYRIAEQLGRRSKHKPCTSIYEVDPKSYIVLRADWEGAPADCIIPL